MRDISSNALSNISCDTSVNTATNIIYTGVAGTGKTYQLLQLAKQYTDYLPTLDEQALLTQLLQPLSWREVVCLVLLDLQNRQQDLAKVPEIVAHEFFMAKARQNARAKNLNSTVWSVLQMHSSVESTTVSCDHRASQAYFDKDQSGAWYLLADSLPLLGELAQQLIELKQAQHEHTLTSCQNIGIKRYSMISFHQAYGYEEFVEGIRPVIGATGSQGQGSQMHYNIQDGAFLKLCQRAASDPKQRYAMLIDELNRANVSRVFGELLSLIEPNKRSGQAQAMQVQLAYSGRPFSVPSNVDIYATMNTQDHSLAPLDMAMRRRFRFIDCPPKPELLATVHCSNIISDDNDANENSDDSYKNESTESVIDLAGILAGLNQRIVQTLGVEAQLGHAFLWSIDTLEELQTALIEQIIPQLLQATGGQLSVLQYLFNDDSQPFGLQFIQDAQLHIDDRATYQTQRTDFNNAGFNTPSSFLGQSMSATRYQINPQLIARSGEFASAKIYQRLY